MARGSTQGTSPGLQRWVPRDTLGAQCRGTLQKGLQPPPGRNRETLTAWGCPGMGLFSGAGSMGYGTEQRDVNGHHTAKPVSFPFPMGPSPTAAPIEQLCPQWGWPGTGSGWEVLEAVDLCLCSTRSPSAMSGNQGNLMVPERNNTRADRHCDSPN